MRRGMLCIGLICLLLSGCSRSVQVEDMAYAVLLGIDLSDDGGMDVSVVVQRVAGSDGNSSEKSQEGQLLFSVAGENFSAAVSALHRAVPRKLDLSQIELIVVSEELARDARFRDAFPEMIQHLYGAAGLVVCGGSAKSFVSEEKPVIGTNIVTELSAMIEDYASEGVIPDVSFADFCYKTCSVYSDPLAIYAKRESGAGEPFGVVQASSDGAAEESRKSNVYLGAAAFRDGKMAGRLSGDEVLCCLLLRGAHLTFPYTVGGESLQLSTLGKPGVDVDIKRDPMKISVDMDFSLLPGSGSADTDELQSALEADLESVIDKCRTGGFEPFEFAEHAAVRYPTLSEWQSSQWRERFAVCEAEVTVTVHSERK